MRDRKFGKLNNTGSTLVMVLVCMLFVGVIASLVLTLTVRNVENTATISDSSGNFYTGENVIDEIQAGLEQVADRAAREAYTQWLQTISFATVSDQEKVFKELFAKRFTELVKNEFVKKFQDGKQDELLVKFDSSSVVWGTDATKIEIVTNADGSVSVKNIAIEYVDSSGGASRIATDLVFSIDNPGFQAASLKGTNLKCSEFVLISDAQIISDQGFPGGRIKGSLYGGGYKKDDGYTQDGIVLQNKDGLKIYADQILTRTGIDIGGSNTDISISGYDGELDFIGSNSDIWARNINISAAKNNTASVAVKGNCYLADDLTLDSEGTSFTMLRGQYYGYSASSYRNTPEKNSAIVLNAKNSSLDLTGASQIWIAGKSFVSVPERWGAGVNADNTTFMQGESIAYRGTQAAYLLPGDCIPSVGHNPMTLSEYNTLDSTSVDISQSRRKGGVRLEDYVDRTTPYKKVNVRYSNSTTMVYLYLNFQSADKAAAYFAEYEDIYGDLVDGRMAMLGNGSIRYNPLSLVTTGNVLGYDNITGVVDFRDRTDNYNDPRIENKQLELESKFTGLVTSLDETYSGSDINDGFLTDSIVDFSKVSRGDVTFSGAASDLPEKLSEESLKRIGRTDYYFISGNNVTITRSYNGIIVAKGNVYIKAGAQVTGLVIARGNIILEGGASLYSDSKNVSYLINNDKTVHEYFIIGTQVEGNDHKIYTSDLLHVSYDNWKKN